MRYVIIGSSAAGINAIRELRKIDEKGEVTLVSKDASSTSIYAGKELLKGSTLQRKILTKSTMLTG